MDVVAKLTAYLEPVVDPLAVDLERARLLDLLVTRECAILGEGCAVGQGHRLVHQAKPLSPEVAGAAVRTIDRVGEVHL